MDARLYQWMAPTSMRVQPWCDETVVAAGAFHARPMVLPHEVDRLVRA